MLACARIGAVHSVVFGGFSPESLAGRIADCASTLVITADEGVRGGKRSPAQGERGRGDRVARARRRGTWSSCGAPAPDVGWVDGARRALRGHRGRGSPDLRAGADERRGSALHPLHLRLDRQAEGRAAHDRRLPGLRRTSRFALRLRLPRGRRLLVHRRRRLGHRPQLHRLRSAVERRDQPDVRGRAELSRHVALLARRRQAPGHDLLHRADRDPRADARGRRAGEGSLARDAAPARHGRRADQPGSLASGTTASSATGAARSSTRGGRPRPAAS